MADQPVKFHKWMHEMTVTENVYSSFEPTPPNTWGPTAKVVSVQDKKGRVAYVPVEWLEKEPKPKVWKVGKVVRGKTTGRVWIKVSDTEWELIGSSGPFELTGRRLSDRLIQATVNWEELN